MKHPYSFEQMLRVPIHLKETALRNPDISLCLKDGGLWSTANDFRKFGIEGADYFDIASPIKTLIFVDYENGSVSCFQSLGQWSNNLSKKFADLEDLAKHWRVEFDLADKTRTVAETGYKLLYAQYMVDHGLSPEDYLPLP